VVEFLQAGGTAKRLPWTSKARTAKINGCEIFVEAACVWTVPCILVFWPLGVHSSQEVRVAVFLQAGGTAKSLF